MTFNEFVKWGVGHGYRGYFIDMEVETLGDLYQEVRKNQETLGVDMAQVRDMLEKSGCDSDTHINAACRKVLFSI